MPSRAYTCAAIYDGDKLLPGNGFTGPAVIEDQRLYRRDPSGQSGLG